MLTNINFTTFFSYVQETPWYRNFLELVIKNVNTNSTLLDIGTGSGKLIQILYYEKQVKSVGIDTNAKMLDEASKKLKHTNVQLLKSDVNQKFPLENDSFDTITICNVLFNLKNNDANFILTEASRVLRKNGTIIVLSPTGKGSFFKLTKKYFSLKNWSIYVWYYATKKRAKSWNETNFLLQYAQNNKFTYQKYHTLNGFALVEILST